MWYVFGSFALIAILPLKTPIKKKLHALILLLPTVLLVHLMTGNLDNPCPNPNCWKDQYLLLAYLFYGGVGMLLTSPFIVLSWAVLTDKDEKPLN